MVTEENVRRGVTVRNQPQRQPVVSDGTHLQRHCDCGYKMIGAYFVGSVATMAYYIFLAPCGL